MTVDAYQEIRRRALERIDGAGLDPAEDSSSPLALLEETVEDYQRMAHLGEGRSLASPEETVRRLYQSVSAHGPLGGLLAGTMSRRSSSKETASATWRRAAGSVDSSHPPRRMRTVRLWSGSWLRPIGALIAPTR